MQLRNKSFVIPMIVGALLLGAMGIFWPAPQANAQCGSQSSSCKNCHEVQQQKPVNNDGTGWHQNHAFGDFCTACHGGNPQATEKTASHSGMAAPLSDVKASCQSCHPNDLMARAQVYATKLGVKVGEDAPAVAGAPATGATPAAVASTSGGGASTSGGAPGNNPSEPPAMVTAGNSNEVIDYSQRYAGTTPINWGNLLLIGMIVLVGGGGGAFIFWNERRLAHNRAPQSLPVAAVSSAPTVEDIPGYSAEVVALLPKLAQLNPVGIHALKRLLENPDQANEMLHSLSKLDPELVRRIRSLDRDGRALLLALAGE